MSDGVTRRVATFKFIDPDHNDNLWVGVTLVRNELVGLSVSLEEDGDYYVFFGADEAG